MRPLAAVLVLPLWLARPLSAQHAASSEPAHVSDTADLALCYDWAKKQSARSAVSETCTGWVEAAG